MQNKRKTCPTHGPVFAVSGQKLTLGELFGGGVLSAVTCGIYFPFLIWKYVRANRESRRFYCPQCGARCK